MKIDFVIPCYGSPGSLAPLVDAIEAAMKKSGRTFEIIMINDACPRGSGAVIKELAQKYSFVTGINLVRNFGQHAAIAAGLKYSFGDYVVVMDCDLQDNPEYVESFLSAAQSRQVDVVLASRSARRVGLIKRYQSRLFHKFMNVIIGFKSNSTVGNFGLYSRRVVDSLHLMGDQSRPFPFLVQWLGYPSTTVEVVQEERFEGKSSYTLIKLLRLALDIAIGFSDRPLRIVVSLGLLISCMAVLFAGLFIFRFFIFGLAPSGWTSLIVAVFLSLGAILSTLGVVGLYVGRTFEQAKKRPVFLVDQIWK